MEMGGRYTSSGYWMRPHLTVGERRELEHLSAERGLSMSQVCREAVARYLAYETPAILGDIVLATNDAGRELNEAARELNRTVRRFGRAIRMKAREQEQLEVALGGAASLAGLAEARAAEVPLPDERTCLLVVSTRFAGGEMARPERVGFRVEVEATRRVQDLCRGERGAASTLARNAIVAEIARSRWGDEKSYVVVTDRDMASLTLSRRRWSTNIQQIENAADHLQQTFTSSRFIDDALRLRLIGKVRLARSSSRSTREALEHVFQVTISRIREV